MNRKYFRLFWYIFSAIFPIFWVFIPFYGFIFTDQLCVRERWIEHFPISLFFFFSIQTFAWLNRSHAFNEFASPASALPTTQLKLNRNNINGKKTFPSSHRRYSWTHKIDDFFCAWKFLFFPMCVIHINIFAPLSWILVIVERKRIFFCAFIFPYIRKQTNFISD